MPGCLVRTLVIDNYDSFTYNLVQYMGHITGVDPVVVRNDDVGWRSEYLAGFDCVVISPGPGKPDLAADFGICPAVIDAVKVPLLGVCLGHQGICHAFGGTVTAAPEPMHGRTSLVRHGGGELFAGIPSPFRVVRYHSLMVAEVADVLEVIGTADDGVPMALRHRARPLWGVQFHPESICTEHGERLLSNFVGMARSARTSISVPSRFQLTHRTALRSSAERGMSASALADLKVLARRVACEASAESVFDALYRDSKQSFWLDSGLRQGDAGRFSFMGDSAGPLARTVSADVRSREITVTGPAGVSSYRGSFFDWIRDDLLAHRAEVPPLPFDFALGWVGYLGYELKAETGGADKHRSPYPDASMIFADRAIAFDHQTGDVYLLVLADAREQPAIAWLDGTERRLAVISRGTRLAHRGAQELGEVRLRHGRASYLDKIASCQREIRAGETYEVCLTNMIEVPGTLDPWPAYRSLRRDNPVPYGALLRLGELSVLSFSPERFLRIDANGVAESKPIKGTRPRGRCAAQDKWLRAELAESEKDRAENLMIVDLVRNDLGISAVPGSVRVERIFDVETFSTVHQLVSTVRARLRPDVHAVDCVRAAFPGGSMTGAPKIRTMCIIDELEARPRGVYSGAIGYLALNGAADLSITIRTLVVAPGMVSFGVGGAITALSDPDAEYEETAVKATALLTLLGQEFPERHDDLTLPAPSAPMPLG
jgi:para-aminobenzoate synthetase